MSEELTAIANREVRVAKRLGLLADVLVRTSHRAITRKQLDATILLLREGESRILDLEQDLRVARAALGSRGPQEEEDAFRRQWRELAEKWQFQSDRADKAEAELAALRGVGTREDLGELPGDDEITTIRWGRLRELFDAEAEVVLRGVGTPQEKEPRHETGSIQFGDDWPGVFMRGDYALPMAFMLRGLLAAAAEKQCVDPITVLNLRGLASTLESCDTRKSAPLGPPSQEEKAQTPGETS